MRSGGTVEGYFAGNNSRYYVNNLRSRGYTFFDAPNKYYTAPSGSSASPYIKSCKKLSGLPALASWGKRSQADYSTIPLRRTTLFAIQVAGNNCNNCGRSFLSCNTKVFATNNVSGNCNIFPNTCKSSHVNVLQAKSYLLDTLLASYPASGFIWNSVR